MTTKTKKFLQRVPLDVARAEVVALAGRTDAESVDVEGSLGRITSAPVSARFASPHYRASAMDGIAVRARDTEGAQGSTPVILEAIDGGDDPVVGRRVCAPVDTGNPMPAWADAVIRVEDTRTTERGFEIRAPVIVGRDVRAIGEDVAAGSVLFGRGHRVRPYDIGAMLATGVGSVDVMRPPTVAVLATGGEVVEPGGDPEPGQVIEYNARMMAGFVAQWGGEHVYLGRVADERPALEKAIRAAAAAHDVVCVIAGSSAGRKDFTVDVLAGCGRLLLHGVDMMPGKPVAIAEIDGKPVIGVPGYPVSAVMVYRELLQPLLATCLGTAPATPVNVAAHVRRAIPSRLGVEELLRVCLAADDEGLVVALLPRGAGSITTLVRADAILRIPATSEGIAAGQAVSVELLTSDTPPGSTVVVSGPPDALGAQLEDRLRSAGTVARFAYLGLADHDAVTAIAAGEAHIAILSIESAADLAAVITDRLPGARRHEIDSTTLLLSAPFTRTPNGIALEALLERPTS